MWLTGVARQKVVIMLLFMDDFNNTLIVSMEKYV